MWRSRTIASRTDRDRAQLPAHRAGHGLKFRLMAAAGLAVGVGVVFGAAGVAACTPDSQLTAYMPDPVASGTVASPGVTGGTFVITTAQGPTVTVTVTGTTTYREQGVSAADLTDVVAGDVVKVWGTIPSAGNVTAAIVAISLPVTSGTVASPGVSGESFPVTTDKGVAVTIDVSAATTYREQGVSSPGLGNVAVGDHVTVSGLITSPGVVSAVSVSISLPVTSGTVASPGVTGSSFPVTTGGGATVTIDVTSSTAYREKGVGDSPGLDNVVVGDHVTVSGPVTSPGTVSAVTVNITLACAFGTVLAPGVTGSSFQIGAVSGGKGWNGGKDGKDEKAGTVTVDVTSATTYTEKGVTSPGLTDVAAGDHVTVLGTITTPGVHRCSQR